MGDYEILQAMQQMFDSLKSDVEQQFDTVKSELHNVRSDLDNMRILIDTEMRRDIQLLAEGHEIILERLPDSTDLDATEARLSAVEAVIKKHSKDIQSLKKAQ